MAEESILEERIKEISVNDHGIICRCCLNKNGNINLFTFENKGNRLCDIYFILSLSQLSEFDDLPKQLCQACTDIILQFYLLKRQTVLSEKLLRKIFEDKNKLVNFEQKSTDNREYSTEQTKKVREKKKDNLTCSFCSIKFETYSEYNLHRKREADLRRKRLPCTICKKLISTYKLKDHVNSHTKERPYQCSICGDKFRFRSSLTRHHFKHTDKKPHECHICGKGFIQAPSLTDHLRTHSGEKSFICNICGKSFITKHSLGNHLGLHKSKDSENLSCKGCNELFTSRNLLKNHLCMQINKDFLCNMCGKKFFKKNLLDSHIKLHSDTKPYICDVCNKGFVHKCNLQKHLLIHTDEKPIACIICDKRFSQKGHLVFHLRKHSGERPYVCTFCDKTFNHTGSLKVHMRIHTGEKPFQCDVCSKGFYDSSSMKKHSKTHYSKTEPTIKPEIEAS